MFDDIYEDLALDEIEPSFQLYFADEVISKNALGKTPLELKTDFFKSNNGNWRDENFSKFETEFFQSPTLFRRFYSF
ncbi:hypothetical protein ThvES_00021320 [Thiovulum sp. ES]|nr:hypothetical protein ThvES_00021320 [Thiovulum sp. ES]